ncbi:hypothetical protein DXG01_010292 [Tephrocybe rancida]|nr:hypothetical protein DXG01_010292 [Tephrocybe rancida]
MTMSSHSRSRRSTFDVTWTTPSIINLFLMRCILHKIAPTTRINHRAEEEEEEEDGDDEGLVEEQLSRQEPDTQSNPSSPQPKPTSTANARTGQQEDSNSQERKRRPGRPRGSKNRKPRAGQTTTKQEPAFYSTPAVVVAPAIATPPQHPDVNAQNQQYYEFQWRVLNLCSEFYTAAEELVKATQPLVIAQCYSMGPGIKVDPLTMLSEAKRICDSLVWFNFTLLVITISNRVLKLSNPSQLVASPPPPINPAAPSFYQPLQSQPVASTSASISAGARPTASVAAPPAVITNPSSFAMPLPTTQPAYAQYQMYAGQYPTTPYYQYPYVTPGAYYQPPAQTAPTVQPQPAVAPPQPTPTPQPEASTSTDINVSAVNVITTGPSGAGVNQGAWSEDETERLKKLAEESKTQSGEIDWDRVVAQWGNGRTRHQILIKATSLGLKESSSRGVKRRRENEGASDAASPSVPPTPTVTQISATVPTSNPPAASPSHSQTGSTPTASPAMQNQQRPPPKPSSGLPWPMPTVAVNTPSPVVAAATTAQDQQRTSYYRARPSQDGKSAATTASAHTHPYMYQPNGSAGPSRLGKENGK